MLRSLVGSEMCIRDRYQRRVRGRHSLHRPLAHIMGGKGSKGYSNVESEESMSLQGKSDEAGKKQYDSVAVDHDRYPKLDGTSVLKEDLFKTDRKMGLSSAEAAQRLLDFGENKLAEKKSNPWLKLALEFVQPMPCVVWLAIIIEATESAIDWPGSSATSDLIDVIVLILLQLLNVLVGWFEELKSNDAIAQLKNSLTPKAVVTRDGESQKIDAVLLVPGDVVSLACGAAVPADCQVMEGCRPIQVDQSALTGESLPVTMKVGDFAKMGSMVKSGDAEALVTGTGGNTFFGKTAELLAIDEMGHFEKVLQQMLIALVTIGAIVNTIVMVYLLAHIHENFKTVLSFCVVLLIASIPIALKVVCTTTLALGAQELAKEKAIVARLGSIEELASLTILCSDKTGTLTMNEMILKEDLDPSQAEYKNLEPNHPGRDKFHRVYDKNPDTGKPYTRQDLVQMCGMATEWNKEAKDAIDTMLLDPNGPLDKDALNAGYEHTEGGFFPFDPSTKRTMACILNKKTGKEFRVAKGATKVMLNMLDKAHRDQVTEDFNAAINAFAERGIRAIAIIRSDDTDKNGKMIIDEETGECKGWRLAGFITFLDPPRPDSAHVIRMAREFGVEVKMITGDAGPIAVEMCKNIGLGHNILIGEEQLAELPVKTLMEDKTLGEQYGQICLDSNGFAQVLPEHKFLIVAALQQEEYIVGMCGDGVNDAPALKKANVGIAVQGATDAAQAASDIVLTLPGLSTIVTAMVVSRKIFTRMKNFVIYRVACTEQLLFFFLISCLAFNPQKYAEDAPGYNSADWPEYFALPVIALVTITILNDGTIISIAYDNVEASLQPEEWNLKIMYWISSVIGGVALGSSILLLHLGLESAKGGNHGLCAFGISPLNFGEVQTMIYLKISLSDYCSVFNSRCKSWCWSRRPHNVVLCAAAFAVSMATILSAYWPFESGMKGIDWDVILFVWIYVLCWSLVQDATKVANGKLLFYLGLVTDLGVIDEKELTNPDGTKGSSGRARAPSDNFGQGIQRPSRRRTSSMTKGYDTQPLAGGFIDPNYDKNKSKVKVAGYQDTHCDKDDQPTHGRDRHYSVDEEPSAHYYK
eukprot:TRINITY_DN8996_c0_g1_i1.p1 TRINITY_DN8996_c0_g1~~TRINITY_DN8996_c0_g1_i1.p1  ORF type:complete len:1094 (-),score=361.29 TRINITY_DN8996_c0_g1_i1:311-3592(-)